MTRALASLTLLALPGLAFPGIALAQDAEAAAPAITMELVDLPIDQQAALRCAVAVAIATEQQRSGTAAQAGWPDLLANERGREFFVRSLAKLMDDTGIAREGLALRGRKEAEKLRDPAALEAVLPACFLMLDASGL